MRAHEWVGGRCHRCGMLSSWPGARYACGDSLGTKVKQKTKPPPRYRKLPPEERAARVQRAGEMRARGASLREIARAFDVYPQLASSYVRAFERLHTSMPEHANRQRKGATS